MKKILSVILTTALVLMLLPLTGCSQKGTPYLRIFMGISGATQEMADDLKQRIIDHGGPTDIEIQLPPSDYDEVSITLTRIRTEMMAGSGPDVFITDMAGDNGLFLSPEKTMALGLLYPLDDYIENAQFMEWDKLNPTVMAAGRSEEYGQVILPITYSFPLTLFLPSDVEHTPSKDITWQDMLNDKTDLLTFVAAPHDIVIYETFVSTRSGNLLSDTFGPLADYKNKQLYFTEEELLNRVYEVLDLFDRKQSGALNDIPDSFTIDGMGSHYMISNSKDFSSEQIPMEAFPNQIRSYMGMEEVVEDNELTMVPVYNDDGGVTATIRTFAAINANTKRINDAFFVLDVLMEESSVRSALLLRRKHQNQVSVYDNVMSREATVAKYWEQGKFGLTQSNFKHYTAARDAITAVKFKGVLDDELWQLMDNAVNIYCGHYSGDIETVVNQTYTRMKRRLSE